MSEQQERRYPQRVDVVTRVSVPAERIDDMLCNALEGGSNYWIERTEALNDKWPEGCEWGHELPTRGGTLVIYLHDDETPIKLKLSHIKRGLDKMATRHTFHWDNFMRENDDADTADAFLQLCAFGEIVYG